ncbi:MAG: glycosyltransferase [Phycisphaerales bacterium]|nr:MAG: glycosyltransferase [Phycisphaerales bacterium]
MICHAFPPTGGPGVQRSVKFAKYLPRFGWRPYIWSASGVRGLPCDPTLVSDVPECAIRRSLPVFEWSSAVRDWGEAVRRRVGWNSQTGRITEAATWRVERMLRRLGSQCVPDDCLTWALRSYGPLCRWVRREGIHAVYSTFSPASNHLLGLLLKSTTARLWVADYRDLWTDDHTGAASRCRRDRINIRLEDRILGAADAVISVSDRHTRTLQRRLHGAHAGKFHTITNGVDLDDYERIARRTGSYLFDDLAAPFRLTFVGHCIRLRFPPEIRQGLDRFRHCARAQRLPIRFRVVGLVSSDLKPWLDSWGCDAEMTGYVDHDRALEEMTRASTLLLTIPRQASGETTVPDPSAKLFEYLGSRRHILLAGERDTMAARIITDCQAGTVCPPEAGPLADALLEQARDWSRGRRGTGCPPDKLAPYTRQATASELARVLDALVPPTSVASDPPHVG